MSSWFKNGEAVEHVAASDRGFQYGDGIFETIAIRDGEPRLWDYHVERLAKGCAALGFGVPTESELSDGVMDALHQSKAPTSYSVAKIIVSAGSRLRGYGRAAVSNPAILYGAFPSMPPPLKSYREGIETVRCRTRLAIHSATAGLKTLNRLEQVLARSEFTDTDTDIFEGFTMDAEDNVICGTMSNVFFINKHSISTPPLNRCGVEGVMRRHVITTLGDNGVEVSVKETNLSEFDSVDEVFVSNSQFGILPVKSCDELQWPVGEITQRVMQVLAENGVAECR
jgi:4-amino-4-deoxychorismate lyase